MRLFVVCVLLTLGLSARAATPQVVGGADHSLALSQDGRVFSWGDDSSGQLGTGRLLFQSTPLATVMPDVKNVAGLAAGSYHSLARMRDGSALAWGNNAYGELGDGTLTSRGLPLKVIGLAGVVALAAGEQHSLAVDNQGKVWAWGSNENGRLGQGNADQANSKLPLQVVQLQNVIAVQAGKAHSLALTQDGRVFAWGTNFSGQLGVSGSSRSTPTPIEFLLPNTRITAIAAASDHSFALDSEGRLWSWGENEYYQLGHRAYARSNEPRYLSNLEAQGKVQSFAVGPVGGAAVLADGSLWVWGFYGRYDEPTRVTGLPGPVAQVKLGESHMVITLVDGRILSTGDNRFGQLGDGSTTSTNDLAFVTPKTVSGPISQLTTGYFHSLALDASGRLLAWGDNTRGQLGIGVAVNRSVPGTVEGLTGTTQIATGHRHALALKTDGTVKAWGDNDEQAVGNGKDDRLFTSPQDVVGLSNVRRVAAGGSSSAALDTTGKLWVWGSNLRGQLAIAEDIYRTNRPTPALGLPPLAEVSVGSDHMLGLDLQGRVWVWGSNGRGQLGDGYDQATAPRVLNSLSNIVAISAAGDHSMALDAQGRVWAWGDNGYKQVGTSDDDQVKVPIQVRGLPIIKAVAAGYFSSLALGVDGSLWAWGEGQEGQLGDGQQDIRATPAKAGDDTYTAVGAGVMHSLALRADGLTWTFGLNFSGQLGDGGYANQSSPVGVVDPALNRFFDLNTTIANAPVAANKIPPFFTQTLKAGSNRLLTLGTRVSLADAKLGAAALRAKPHATGSYNLYVVAVLAGALPANVTPVWVRAASGWGPFVNFPVGEYLRNLTANSDQVLLIDILESTDLSTAVGTRFFVGYGTSAEEMLSSGRFRLVYEVLAGQ
ncbi:MAG: RCC1 repeat-containing protein [Burkholderiales bacterium PBB3]|nr:MAG: RCC1 repeat-containing protein [Burkholderiales bacterium PBB3]